MMNTSGHFDMTYYNDTEVEEAVSISDISTVVPAKVMHDREMSRLAKYMFIDTAFCSYQIGRRVC